MTNVDTSSFKFEIAFCRGSRAFSILMILTAYFIKLTINNMPMQLFYANGIRIEIAYTFTFVYA